MRSLYLIPVLLCGCVAAETVDEACPERIPGQRHVSGGAEDFLVRMSCFRRFVGLSSIPVRGPVQRAVEAHVLYLDENGILDPTHPNYFIGRNGMADANKLFGEDPNLPMFTGRHALERLNAEQALDAGTNYVVWDVFLLDIDDDWDQHVHDPWTRDVVFQPQLAGAGFARFTVAGVEYGYANIPYVFPTAVRIDRPIVYPRDGQGDVPTTYAPWMMPQNPIAVASRIGYPITITVGSDQPGGSVGNPFNLRFLEARLEDQEGRAVELVTAGPGVYPWGRTQATLVAAPVRPLEPDTTYTFEAVINWNSRQNKVVRTTFTTEAGDMEAVDPSL